MTQLTLIAPLVVRVAVRDGETRAEPLHRAAAALADGLDALCHERAAPGSSVSVAARGKVRVRWDQTERPGPGDLKRPHGPPGLER